MCIYADIRRVQHACYSQRTNLKNASNFDHFHLFIRINDFEIAAMVQITQNFAYFQDQAYVWLLHFNWIRSCFLKSVCCHFSMCEHVCNLIYWNISGIFSMKTQRFIIHVLSGAILLWFHILTKFFWLHLPVLEKAHSIF